MVTFVVITPILLLGVLISMQRVENWVGERPTVNAENASETKTETETDTVLHTNAVTPVESVDVVRVTRARPQATTRRARRVLRHQLSRSE